MNKIEIAKRDTNCFIFSMEKMYSFDKNIEFSMYVSLTPENIADINHFKGEISNRRSLTAVEISVDAYMIPSNDITDEVMEKTMELLNSEDNDVVEVTSFTGDPDLHRPATLCIMGKCLELRFLAAEKDKDGNDTPLPFWSANHIHRDLVMQKAIFVSSASGGDA